MCDGEELTLGDVVRRIRAEFFGQVVVVQHQNLDIVTVGVMQEVAIKICLSPREGF